MKKKYELTDETINVGKHILHRIKALIDFNDVKSGDLGGFIEKEDNLDHNGNCWIYDDAMVFDNARVSGNAKVFDNAIVSDNAKVYDNARVYGNAEVYDNTWVYDDARVFGNARLSGHAKVCDNACVFGNARVYGNSRLSDNAYISNTNDYITIGPIGSRDSYTTFYLDKDRNIHVVCGCFNGDINEFKYKVLETHKNNDLYREQYIKSIKYVKDIFS